MNDLVEVLARAIRAVDTDWEGPPSLLHERHARAALTALESAGYRVVPVDPTDAMIDAYVGHGDAKRPMEEVGRERWMAMLAAAPKVMP